MTTTNDTPVTNLLRSVGCEGQFAASDWAEWVRFADAVAVHTLDPIERMSFVANAARRLRATPSDRIKNTCPSEELRLIKSSHSGPHQMLTFLKKFPFPY